MAKKKESRRNEKGRGSFRYRENGKVEYRFSYKDEFGVPQRKSLTADSEHECLEKAFEWINRKEKIWDGFDAEATIIDILKARYQIDYEMNYLSEAGYGRNLDSLKIIERGPLGGIPIHALQKRHIESYLKSITRYSNSVIEKLFQQIKLAFSIAYDKGIIDKDIMQSKDIRKPRSSKPDRKVRGLTVEEQNILVKALTEKKTHTGRNDYHLQIFIELYSGMRMGEINALRAKDIDLDNNVVHVRSTISYGINHRVFLKDSTKTYAGVRDVPISNKLKPFLVEALKRYKANPDGLLFYDHNANTVISTNQVNSFFQRLCSSAGLPKFGQHALRHTFATRCIESGIPPVVLKTWLGHKDIHVTLDTYTDVFKSMDNDAVKKFDEYINGM